MHLPVLLRWRNSGINCSKWRWRWVQHLINTNKSKTLFLLHLLSEACCNVRISLANLLSSLLSQLEKKNHKWLNFIYSMTISPDPFVALLRIQRLNTVLNEKEDSLRKLKETLRKQQGEESCKSAVLLILPDRWIICSVQGQDRV